MKEAAKRLGVNRSTVYDLCERGELAHLRVSNSIRISAQSLVRFVQPFSPTKRRASALRVRKK